ncbi:hypothetical protein SAMN05444008_111161 [Cnuella takakiae]|uniref:HTH cro/C1-type domain-containing protein n=1 Tax=Cnuella takakiae TaxID=1302690 RepID=A0A1M5E1C7_9BACT|nr:hypothetical protein [Cnuella takakiae]OLY93809.1 hypothetical protein BUE76_19425 [Cnuella takakiae]SHF72872.1 hypothetical protein SAMN05444008_111161 [Cnuella takakiae]
MKENNLALLLSEVEQTFTRKILIASDCIQLSEEILNKTGFKLNSNTLRRCFGLVKSTYPPSITTVNILARYTGFSSFDEFVQYKSSAKAQEPEASKSLLKYLIYLFKALEIEQKNDATAMKLIQTVIRYYKYEPQIIYPLQKELARTKSGQDYYFEEAVNIDRLASYYGDGLRYFLHEKRTAEAQIFGHSLLALRSWLLHHEAALEKHYQEVLQYPLHPGLHSFVKGRHFATRLLYAHSVDADPSLIIKEASVAFKNLIPTQDHYRHYPCFQLIIAEALMLTGNFDEAFFYASNGVAQLKSQETAIHNHSLFHALFLYQAYALAQSGDIKKAKELFERIDPGAFYFLSKQYLTIFYLYLSAKVNRTKLPCEQLDFLVKETGFKKLAQLEPQL